MRGRDHGPGRAASRERAIPATAATTRWTCTATATATSRTARRSPPTSTASTRPAATAEDHPGPTYERVIRAARGRGGAAVRGHGRFPGPAYRGPGGFDCWRSRGVSPRSGRAGHRGLRSAVPAERARGSGAGPGRASAAPPANGAPGADSRGGHRVRHRHAAACARRLLDAAVAARARWTPAGSTARSPSTRCWTTAPTSSTGWPSRWSSRCGPGSRTRSSTWSRVPSAPLQRILYQSTRTGPPTTGTRSGLRGRVRGPAPPVRAGHQRDRAGRPAGQGGGGARRARSPDGRTGPHACSARTPSPCSPGPAATCATTRARSSPGSPPTSGSPGRNATSPCQTSDLREYWDKIPVTLIDGVQHDFWRVSEHRLRAALRPVR